MQTYYHNQHNTHRPKPIGMLMVGVLCLVATLAPQTLAGNPPTTSKPKTSKILTHSQSIPVLELAEQNVLLTQTRNDRNVKRALAYATNGQWQSLHNMGLHISNDYKNNKTVIAVTWLAMLQKNNPYDFEEMALFLTRHPYLPKQTTLRVRAEEKITPKTPQKALITWFDNNQYHTYKGAKQYLTMLKLRGEITEYQKLIVPVFHTLTMSLAEQAHFIKNHKKLLSHADFVRRIDTLLWARQTTAAKKLLPYISKDYQRLFRARIAVILNQSGLNTKIAQVPKHLLNDDGLMFDRARWRYKRKLNDGALDIYVSRPDTSRYPSRWYELGSLLAQRLLYQKRYRDAYNVAKAHQNYDPSNIVRAEFLAGFIALRLLNEPENALSHFYNLHAIVRFPISRSRALYWLGRTYAVLGNEKRKKYRYQQAGQYFSTFYGQLALAELGRTIPTTPTTTIHITPERSQDFNENPVIGIIAHLNRNGENRLANTLAKDYIEGLKSEHTLYQLAVMGHKTGQYQWAVWAARKSGTRGTILHTLGYPVPQYIIPHIQGNAHDSLGIMRQESSFQTDALSSAGAIGMMQIMPYTAKTLAKRMKIKYSKPKLSHDPIYNTKMGSYYLTNLFKQWNGSYPQAFASYNAGPHRVKRWNKNHKQDMNKLYSTLDWIELIPFSETRNYVMRVMENVMIYKAKLENKPQEIIFNQK